jgi:hypothetical protein
MLKLKGALLHPFLVAVALTFPTNAAPVLLVGAVYEEMFPDPLRPKPIAPLSFVHVKVEPTTLVTNAFGEIALPGQTEIFG